MSRRLIGVQAFFALAFVLSLIVRNEAFRQISRLRLRSSAISTYNGASTPVSVQRAQGLAATGGSSYQMKGAVEGESYDYIIVGGGIGGCVLANRLTESGKKKVLLLEAGKPSFNNFLVNIPAGVIRLFKSALDWQFESAPEAKLDGKEVYLIRGKTLGGSSALNVMLVNRGTASDYERWEAAGATGWGPSEALKYFKKAEDYRVEGATTPSQFHSTGGEYPVSDVQYQNPLSVKFLEACEEFGIPRNDDFNDWSRAQEGYGRFKVAQKNGKRITAAAGYLTKDVRKRKNLSIETEAFVTRIVLDGNKAVGVEYLGKDGRTHTASLGAGGFGEVLLAGGAIQSPHLLLLSGIGPAKELEAVGVKPAVDLPGVGSNLQDHPAVLVAHDITKKISITDDLFIRKAVTKPQHVLRWLLTGSGPLTSPGCDHGAFLRTRPDISESDLQLRFVPGRGSGPDGVRSYIDIGDAGQPQSGLTVQVVGCRAKSTGKVSLASKDPMKKPRIECRYLSNEDDLATLRKGLEIARGLTKQSAFKDVIGPELFPGPNVQSDEDLNAYIRGSLHTANALVGTCRIGSPSDKDAVVDPTLKVIGASNLRVVDASVMPFIPGGQTGSSTTMVAERAADLIRVAAGDFIESGVQEEKKNFLSRLFGSKKAATAA